MDINTINKIQTEADHNGIIPALESSHAVAHALKLAPTVNQDEILVVTISGRGDKDMEQVMEYLNK